ncbi:hypothetical protein RHGRI_016536 [Rhododendron griersonianum]|uniref:NADH:quinone oxidoreductase/Mrp antiporter transmembrane domain-containing protein n=1 Tax=Rhododendron griersonianum TaxID=479676 RepID=A0AAV6JUV0_9ERIC|nr:hypothetical protein RHGRI_016536 [Rhododendron griersonianum]
MERIGHTQSEQAILVSFLLSESEQRGQSRQPYIASMILGALAAMAQTKVKRLLAYSSIGHVGIPPLAGFCSKFYLFFAALGCGAYFLAPVGVVTSVIGRWAAGRLPRRLVGGESDEGQLAESEGYVPGLDESEGSIPGSAFAGLDEEKGSVLGPLESGELKVGMKVCSDDEAYNLYNEYALRKGFSIRRGNKRQDMNGILRQREYLCSKAGYRKIGSISEMKNLIIWRQEWIKPMSLLQVIQYYEEKVEEMRRDEISDDFQCKNGAPPKVNKRGILNHASKVYTLVMFKTFEEELLDSFGLDCVEISFNETTSVYHVMEDGRQRVHIVQLIFPVMKSLVVRWSRSAKSGIEGDVGGSLHQEGKSTCSLRLSELNHMGQNVFGKGSLSRKCTEIVKDKLREALKMVEEEIANSNSVDDLNCVEEDITACIEEMPSLTDDRQVLDPLCIRTKGSTNARIKSYWEKKKEEDM